MLGYMKTWHIYCNSFILKCFSGGTHITVTGENLDAVSVPVMVVTMVYYEITEQFESVSLASRT